MNNFYKTIFQVVILYELTQFYSFTNCIDFLHRLKVKDSMVNGCLGNMINIF